MFHGFGIFIEDFLHVGEEEFLNSIFPFFITNRKFTLYDIEESESLLTRKTGASYHDDELGNGTKWK